MVAFSAQNETTMSPLPGSGNILEEGVYRTLEPEDGENAAERSPLDMIRSLYL